MVLWPSRPGDRLAVKALQTRLQHRAIDLAKDSGRDMDDARGIDPEEVAVEGQVVNGAERQSIDDRRDPGRLDVWNDVRGLNERSFAERADRAAVAVRAHDVDLEALLVEAMARFSRRVRAHVGGRPPRLSPTLARKAT